MKNIILLICLVVLLSGCATSFQAQREAVSKSYDDKKITKEEYEKKLAKIERASRLAWERERDIERKKKASHEFFALCDNCNGRFRFTELDAEESGGHGNCPYCGSDQNFSQANQRSINQARAMMQQAMMDQIVSRAMAPRPIPQYQPPTKPKTTTTTTTGRITPMGLGTYEYSEQTTSR